MHVSINYDKYCLVHSLQAKAQWYSVANDMWEFSKESVGYHKY